MEQKEILQIQQNPIGFFDSGVGGTSIWKEVHHLLPHENSIYLADSKNAPYGVKDRQTIIDLSVKNTEILLEKGCKLIVVACNTATTNAIDFLRKNYSVPFIGIEPAIKPALLNSKTKSIGILATKGTLSSDLFHRTMQIHSGDTKVVEQEGTGIVELIEGGKLYSEAMKKLLIKYTSPMLSEKIDHLVLGCSHYPYLIPILKEILPASISIIDSGLAVAKQTKNVLEQAMTLNPTELVAKQLFYTNGDPQVLRRLLGASFKIQELDF